MSDSLHQQIMNLPPRGPKETTSDYLVGHRDARHAAAELVAAATSAQEARIARLREALSNLIRCASQVMPTWNLSVAIGKARSALEETKGMGTAGAAPCQAPSLTDVLEEFDNQLSSWARAYPEGVFPEPDMTLVRTALEARGITIDCVTASNMRHVVTHLNKLFQPVRDALARGSNVPKGQQ